MDYPGDPREVDNIKGWSSETTAGRKPIDEIALLAADNEWEFWSNETLDLYYEGAMPDIVNAMFSWHDVRFNMLYGEDFVPSRVVFHKDVTRIGANAFTESRITSLEIPYTVKSIGEYAFYNSKLLTNVDIPYAPLPNGLISIGNSAFSRCSSLETINIPNSVTSIGDSAFSNCSQLKDIQLSIYLTSISNSMLKGCAFSSIIIPKAVTSIGTSAFRLCNNLTSIKIPTKVTTIKNFAFYGCDNLTSITIPVSVTSIGDSAFSPTHSWASPHRDVYYAGSEEDWNKISKGRYYGLDYSNVVIHYNSPE